MDVGADFSQGGVYLLLGEALGVLLEVWVSNLLLICSTLLSLSSWLVCFSLLLWRLYVLRGVSNLRVHRLVRTTFSVFLRLEFIYLVLKFRNLLLQLSNLAKVLLVLLLKSVNLGVLLFQLANASLQILYLDVHGIDF